MNIVAFKFKSKLYDEEEQNKLMSKLKNATTIEEIEILFNKLYDNMTKVLWNNLAKKFMPPLSMDDMMDIFQDAWIKVIDSRYNYDSTKKAYNWIYTIFKNMIIDKIRSNDRKKTNRIDEKNEDNEIKYDVKSDDNDLADSNILDNEKAYFIKKAIDSLDDKLDKDIIYMRIFQEKKFDEISKELNIPIATIHYKLNKSLNILRKKLNFLVN